MRRGLSGRLAGVLLAVALSVPAGALAGSDVTVSGEYVDRPVSTIEALVLRLVAGDRVQFRAHVPALRVTSPDSVVLLPSGPVPLDEEQRLRREAAMASGDSSNSGGSMTSGALLLAQDLDPLASDRTVTGVGDVRLGLAARLFGRPAGLYMMDLELDVKAPTADADQALGTGEWDGRVGFAGERRFWTATTFAGMGWTRMGDPAWIDFRNPLDAYWGIESEPLGPGILLSGWIEGSSEVVPGAGGRTALALGLRGNRRNAWRLSATVGLTDAAEDFGVRLGFTIGGATPRSRAQEVRK